MKGWELCLNGKLLSLFDTFFEAERSALSAAEASRHRGRRVNVVAQTTSGTINLLHKAGAGSLDAADPTPMSSRA